MTKQQEKRKKEKNLIKKKGEGKKVGKNEISEKPTKNPVQELSNRFPKQESCRTLKLLQMGRPISFAHTRDERHLGYSKI